MARFFSLRTTAIVVAAGRGTRLGAPAGKGFLPIAGQPMMVYALKTLASVAAVTEIVLVVAPDECPRAEALLATHGPWQRPVRITPGGKERQDSVAAGLAAIGPDTDLVLVHDAARPFVSPQCIDACLSAAATSGAAIAAVPATDTVKVVDADGWIVDTPDRSRLWLAQTPQVFRLTVLQEAYRRAGTDAFSATDDATLAERLGHPVRVVTGNPENRKITTPDDLRWAEWYAGSQQCDSV